MTSLVISTFGDDGKVVSSADITQILKDKVSGVSVTDFCISRTGELYFFSNAYDTGRGASSSSVFCFDNGSGLKLIKEFPNRIGGMDELVSGVCVGVEVNADTSGIRCYSAYGLCNESDVIKELSLGSYYGITDVYGYQSIKALWGEAVSYIWYPSSNRNGMFLLDHGKGYVITAQSPYKEVLWQIMKKMVMNSKLAESGFPAHRRLFEEACDRAKEKKMEVTSDGEEAERAKLEFRYDGMEFKIYAATEEEIAAIKGLLKKAEPMQPYSVKIENIIAEEAAAFFNGQKNLDEVAEAIQNRVFIYVNE